MSQGSTGEKVRGKRDRMITAEKERLGSRCRGYSSAALTWLRDDAVAREHSQNLADCQEQQNAK